MQHLRLSIGFGTVGRWLAGAVHQHQSWLEADCGVDLSIVGVATRREGFRYREDGFDISVCEVEQWQPIGRSRGRP